jgi:Flp pilus assembly pilin Flp
MRPNWRYPRRGTRARRFYFTGTSMTRSPLAIGRAQFWGNEQGIAITEYGLLIALVAILLIGVVTVFSSSITSWFTAKTNKITSF